MAKNKPQQEFVKEITPRDVDFAQWYTDVIRKTDMVDYAPVRGCMVIKPYGYGIWELIQKHLDAKFKQTGHENVYMPMLLPESLLMKEADHVEGFAPECAWVTQGGSEPLAERLAMRGFEARVAYDGPEALKAVELPTDVIVLDLRIPGMDGFEVLRNVKKSNPQVQVIILTGHGGDAEEQTAYRMGAYNFLRKPMDIDELLSSIRMAYRDKLENAMVAVSMAEGGDFEAARDVLNEKDLLAEHK